MWIIIKLSLLRNIKFLKNIIHFTLITYFKNILIKTILII